MAKLTYIVGLRCLCCYRSTAIKCYTLPCVCLHRTHMQCTWNRKAVEFSNFSSNLLQPALCLGRMSTWLCILLANTCDVSVSDDRHYFPTVSHSHSRYRNLLLGVLTVRVMW